MQTSATVAASTIDIAPHSPDPHKAAFADRKRHTDAVLACANPKRVVIAGPGTGKTTLFKHLLRGKRNALTLSFVTALIEDLSVALCGVSDVRTLHSFARSAMKTATGKSVKVFPSLSKVIAQDADVLLGDTIDFDTIFRNREPHDARLDFYSKRRRYYDHFGFTDMVYAAVLYFEKYRDRVPAFDQIVVDEYQDFNALEVSLIDLLAEKSPILIAGDDDQSLYQSLTSASPTHIRRKAQVESGYDRFSLPYCSRCTRVIVDAVNDIISSATSRGLLRDRTTKEFKYFPADDKDKESDAHPHIIRAKCYPNQIVGLITNQISHFASTVQREFTVLVISPTGAIGQKIVRGLRKRGLRNVKIAEKKTGGLTLRDALRLLVVNSKCNLGWRVAAKAIFPERDFAEIVSRSQSCEVPFWKLMPTPIRGRIRDMLKTFRDAKEGKDVDPDKFDELARLLGWDAGTLLKSAFEKEFADAGQCDAAIRNTPVVATTIPSSKGLAADCVFFAQFDDRVMLRGTTELLDQHVYSFLVAFTRAKTKLFLLSCDKANDAAILKFVDPSRIEVFDYTATPKRGAPSPVGGLSKGGRGKRS